MKTHTRLLQTVLILGLTAVLAGCSGTEQLAVPATTTTTVTDAAECDFEAGPAVIEGEVSQIRLAVGIGVSLFSRSTAAYMIRKCAIKVSGRNVNDVVARNKIIKAIGPAILSRQDVVDVVPLPAACGAGEAAIVPFDDELVSQFNARTADGLDRLTHNPKAVRSYPDVAENLTLEPADSSHGSRNSGNPFWCVPDQTRSAPRREVPPVVRVTRASLCDLY